MLRTYALAPDTVRRQLRRSFWRYQLITTLTFLAFGLYLAFLAGPVRWSIAGPMIGIVALTYFCVIFFNYRQQLRVLYSARYEIDDNSVTYRQIQQQPLHIPRADIIEVIERDEGYWIETVNPRYTLLVPNGLARNGDADFLATLQAWVKVHPAPRKKPWERWLWTYSLGGSLLVLFFANSLWIIIPFGIFILIFGTYAEQRLRNHHKVALRITRDYSLAFSFLVFVIGMKVCFLALTLMAKK